MSELIKRLKSRWVYVSLGTIALLSSLSSVVMYFYYNKYSELTSQLSALFDASGLSEQQIENSSKSMIVEGRGISMYGIVQLETAIYVSIGIAVISMLTIIGVYVVSKMKRYREEKNSE